MFTEPVTFGALCVKGEPNVARALEGPVPDWKKFGQAGSGNGASGTAFGLPRFREARFRVRFPFATVSLADKDVPFADLRIGKDPELKPGEAKIEGSYKPWYAERFKNVSEVTDYWREHYATLRANSLRFSDCCYDSRLPAEVIEAVAANLTILKSPTVMRQADGRFWGWEGCFDGGGCCHGSCTHVWNYAKQSRTCSRRWSGACVRRSSVRRRTSAATSNSALRSRSDPWHMISTPPATASWAVS